FRSGLGAQQVPSGLVILGLSVALTFSIMSPTIEAFRAEVDAFPWKALERDPKSVSSENFAKLLQPWRVFLERHTGERERVALTSVLIQQTPPPADDGAPLEIAKDVDLASTVSTPWSVLLPAFMVTELKEGFLIGFMLLLPFLVVDLVVANILAGVGMFMVSPVMISLPIKIALFVFADGWILLASGIAQAYSGNS
ncbi:MAG: EscR/YscR/HrcR family type III secretion system export apparatus protein, partial [Bdellovibrionales bacterium]|nr:EscR/YscR/HrcR family type III secretion system export apparatus protein [Bdellovibrionales bacterium]